MRFILLLVLGLALSACGFHLRGLVDLPFETLYVESGGNAALDSELSRAVRGGSKTRLVSNPAEAEAILQILGSSQEKRILSLSGAGRVREYQLLYRISFRLIDRQKRELIPRQQIELKRDMTYDDSQMLAKQNEEDLLYRDMRSDAVQQIMRRVSVAKAAANDDEAPANETPAAVKP